MKKKLGLLALALVLATGAMGLGYASWIDTLYISGTVNTGTVCVDIGSTTLDDELPAPPPYVVGVGAPGADTVCKLPGYGFQRSPNLLDTEKNVGWATVEEKDPIPDTDPDTLYKRLQLDLHNVYPCYYNHLDFWLHGCGTIPARIYRVTFKDEFGNVLTAYDRYGDSFPAILDAMNASPSKYLAFDFNGNGVLDFEIHWGNNWGAQLHECDYVNMSMAIHVMQDVEMEGGETFTFIIELEVIQWDEYPY
jgi:hypothetical protein